MSMASIADTDSLSGFEPLDSTTTSPLLTATANEADLDHLSPASQLSSLRASMAQSGALLSPDPPVEVGEAEGPLGPPPISPTRGVRAPVLTASSLERHNVAHRSRPAPVDAVGGGQRSVPRGSDLRGKVPASLPVTPLECREADPARRPATEIPKRRPPTENRQISALGPPLSVRQTPAATTTATTAATTSRQLFGDAKPATSGPDLLGRPQNLDSASMLNGVRPRGQQPGQRSGQKAADTDRICPDARQESLRTSMAVTPEFQEMEKVRRSLYHMVHSAASRQAKERDSLESRESVGDLLGSHWSGAQNGLAPRESFDSIKTEALLSPNAYQDVSPLALDSGLGQSSVRAHNSSRDGSLFAENHLLKDSLEKERFRRKHCEKQISDLQADLLETQQQLAVAVSTDRKKDAMIEQLDKTLARIVEGWRKQEKDKTETLDRMMAERQQLLGEMDTLKEGAESQRAEVQRVEERLGRELQQALRSHQDTTSQLVAAQEDLSKVRGQLASEQQQLAQALQRQAGSNEERHRLEKQVKQIQQMLAEERQQAQSVRKEFQEKVQHFEREREDLAEKQKAQAAAETRTSKLLEARQEEVEKLREDLQNAVQDKENARLELSLQRAESEAAQQRKEAEQQEALEEVITERLRAVQSRSSAAEAELRESQRSQLAQLREQQQGLLRELRQAHGKELELRDRRLREQAQQYQSRLEQHHQDMSRMTDSLEKAQQQRSVLVQQLQGVQSYCTDALSQMTRNSPLLKVFRSGMDGTAGAGPDPLLAAHGAEDKRRRGTRPQHSPITIAVSPPRRGVGVGAGLLEDNKHEHENGDGEEMEESFHYPNLSLAVSQAPDSPPTTDPFAGHADPLPSQQESLRAGLSQYFRERSSRDDNPETGRSRRGQEPAAGSRHPVKTAPALSEPSCPELQYDLGTSALEGIQPLAQALHYLKREAGQPMQAPSDGASPRPAPASSRRGQQDPRGSQVGGLRSDSAAAAEEESRRKETEDFVRRHFSKPPLAPSSLPHRSHSEVSKSATDQKQDLVRQGDSSPGASRPSRDSEVGRPELPAPLSPRLLPGQDLIAEGLRLLAGQEMSPPSSHSSPLASAGPAAAQPGRGRGRGPAGLTLAEALGPSGRGWDAASRRPHHHHHHPGEQEYTDFREIKPTLDDTKTTNSVAVDPSEDETISEVESGSIPAEKSQVLLEKLAEHKQRQMALQHYIQVLLQQAPAAAGVSQGLPVTKETAAVAMEMAGIVGGGVTGWSQQPTRPAKRGPPASDQPARPRAPQPGPGPPAPLNQPSRPEPQHKARTGAPGSGGARAMADRPAAASKPRGPATGPSHAAARSQRHGQRGTAPSKTSKPAAASLAPAQRKVTRKVTAVRN